MTEALVVASNLGKHFDAGGMFRRRHVRAVDDVSFTIARGETLGLVGESGSGKSTLGRVVIGLLPATAGHSSIAGVSTAGLRGRARRAVWRRAQMVFQDPYASLNPKLTVRDTLREPLRNYALVRGQEADALVRRTLDACGLPEAAAGRYPHEFSGGQRQRIGIARALILRPDFIVADEPVSALDVSIQAQIINLLQDLKAELGLTYLFIAHDLAVVRHVSDRVAVMYRGRLVEVAPAETLFRRPLHPYTQLLLRSVPIPDPEAEAARLAGLSTRPEAELAAPPPNGCAFAPRCPLARFPICAEEVPPLSTRHGETLAACHFADGQRAVPAPAVAA